MQKYLEAYKAVVVLKLDPAKVKEDAFSKATKRAANYSFKYREKVNISESNEMVGKRTQKFESLKSPPKKWEDRNSLIAAPIGAEVYLDCEQGCFLLAGPRYYQDEMKDPERLPNASVRFPYSDLAHESAKKIQYMLVRNLMRRHDAATRIQRIYRVHVTRCRFKKEVELSIRSIKKIQRFYLSRLDRLRRRWAKQRFQLRCLIKAQSLVRAFLLRKRLPSIREQHEIKMKTLHETKDKQHQKEIRRMRGLERRMKNHAIRVQKYFRGNRARAFIRKMHQSQRVIRLAWKRYWMRYYGKRGKQILKFYRYNKLRILIVKIQRLVRGFVGRRRAGRHRLKVIAAQRVRSTSEQMLLAHTIIMFSKQGKDWLGNVDPPKPPTVKKDGKSLAAAPMAPFVQPDYITVQLAQLDFLCSQIIAGKLISRHTPMVPPKQAGQLPTPLVLTRKQRVTLAILTAFSNRPDNHLDYAAMEAVRKYLRPGKNPVYTTEEEEQKVAASAASAKSATAVAISSTSVKSSEPVPASTAAATTTATASMFKVFSALSLPALPCAKSVTEMAPLASAGGSEAALQQTPDSASAKSAKGKVTLPPLVAQTGASNGSGSGSGSGSSSSSSSSSSHATKKAIAGGSGGTVGGGNMGENSNTSSGSTRKSSKPNAGSRADGNGGASGGKTPASGSTSPVKGIKTGKNASKALSEPPKESALEVVDFEPGDLDGTGDDTALSRAGDGEDVELGDGNGDDNELTEATDAAASSKKLSKVSASDVVADVGSGLGLGSGSGSGSGSVSASRSGSSHGYKATEYYINARRHVTNSLAANILVDSNEILWASLLLSQQHRALDLALSGILEPATKSLYWKAVITGRLPPLLLLHAVMMRRWTKYIYTACVQTILDFRAENPPKLFCNRCLEPMLFVRDLKSGGGHGCKRNRSLTWIRRASFKPAMETFAAYCGGLDLHPALIVNAKEPNYVPPVLDPTEAEKTAASSSSKPTGTATAAGGSPGRPRPPRAASPGAAPGGTSRTGSSAKGSTAAGGGSSSGDAPAAEMPKIETVTFLDPGINFGLKYENMDLIIRRLRKEEEKKADKVKKNEEKWKKAEEKLSIKQGTLKDQYGTKKQVKGKQAPSSKGKVK